MKKIDCFHCVHHYITWDRNFPYGCRAISFKAKRMPSEEVYRSSGEKCLAFSPKTKTVRKA
ncbi:MAG: hypothetical protein U0411_01400 [Thermodesulfovibrionales bacterium]